MCFADQDGVRGALLLGDRAHGADRDGRGHDDALLGGQVLPAQALEETAGKMKSRQNATATTTDRQTDRQT